MKLEKYDESNYLIQDVLLKLHNSNDEYKIDNFFIDEKEKETIKFLLDLKRKSPKTLDFSQDNNSTKVKRLNIKNIKIPQKLYDTFLLQGMSDMCSLSFSFYVLEGLKTLIRVTFDNARIVEKIDTTANNTTDDKILLNAAWIELYNGPVDVSTELYDLSDFFPKK